MSFTEVVVSFVLYGFIGWIIDTADRSFDARRIKSGSFLRIPFTPIYGFGSLLVIWLHTLIGSWSFVVQGVIYGAVLAFFEFISGELILKLFHRRLWDYPRGILNFGHFTNLAHAIVWGLVALVLVLYVHPFIVTSLHLR